MTMAEMGEDAADALSSTEAAGTRAGPGALAQLFARLDAAGSADRTLGAPRTVGERSVLPLGEVWYGHGFGLGGGERPGEGEHGAAARTGYGGGGGGGGRVRPVAVVEVGPDGARVHPVVDVAAIGLALAPVALVAVLRLLRARPR
jgi:uncharacterized spore protein YtfJ